jgi:hypothetical protein
MKKLTKLLVFFSLVFILMFAAAAGLRFLALRLGWLCAIPQLPEKPLSLLISAADWALSFALYGSLLLGLSYAARERVFTPAAALCLCILSLAFCFGAFTGLEQWKKVPAATGAVNALGEPGLVLTNSMSGNGTMVILLKGPAVPEGPRVAAIPNRPLLYQEEAPAWGSARPGLPPVPFRDETPWFLKSLAIDIRLSAEQMGRRCLDGALPFLIYAGSLILFLSSLGFIFRLSAWPLANLALGSLAFRGVLALETFFNSQDMQDVFDSFLQKKIPVSMASPLIFCGLGLLVYIYVVLVYLAKRRDIDED